MSKQLTILSTIKTAPVSYFVYSSLSFYGSLRGGALPGMWFVGAIGDAGRDKAAIRQTLYRMERERELVARKVGRVKLYAATPYAHAEISAGLARLFEPTDEKWDGQWTIVHLALHHSRQRVDRERVVALLGVEGFAPIGANTYAHPRADGVTVRNALASSAREFVTIVRGPLVSNDATSHLISHWNPRALAQRYRTVHARLEQLERRLDRASVPHRDAFLLRFAVVFDFLGVAWSDPRLPRRLLPRDWPGEHTRKLAALLYKRLLPGAIAHGDRLLADALPDTHMSMKGDAQ